MKDWEIVQSFREGCPVCKCGTIMDGIYGETHEYWICPKCDFEVHDLDEYEDSGPWSELLSSFNYDAAFDEYDNPYDNYGDEYYTPDEEWDDDEPDNDYDEYYENDESEPDEGCASCGNSAWPNCKTSCSRYDV